jgi:bacillithiol synthase
MAIPMNEIPHLPPLVDAYFSEFSRVGGFFNGDFRDPDAFRRQGETVRRRRLPREALAEILRHQNKSYGCGPRTLDQIDRIVRDQACAVVTGQQVGLFSGPLYTIYKALTAIQLADDLDRKGPGAHVPVFWLASDDHDAAEIDHISLVDKENKLEEIRCAVPSRGSRIPASGLMLPPEIAEAVGSLKDLTLESEFKAEIVGHLQDAYRSGRSFPEAFGLWMTRLFTSRGLIFIDGSDPRLKEIGRDVFVREIAEDSPSTRAAAATSGRLLQNGFAVQIPLHEGILNVFHVDQERRTIQAKNGAFEIKGAAPRIEKGELLALAREKPFLFSPNVLLRPLYQDALLPTIAYIGGPGEISYFAQMQGVYEAFGLPMPVIYPRKGLTIVEKKIGHILKKYGLAVTDIWRDAESLQERISRNQIPPALQERLGLALGHVAEDMDSLKTEVMALDLTLGDSVDQAKGRMGHQLSFLEKKIVQAAKKRSETAIGQVGKAILNLYPGNHLQERVFNIVPYLIKYGYPFMDTLDRAIDIEEFGHQILSME